MSKRKEDPPGYEHPCVVLLVSRCLSKVLVRRLQTKFWFPRVEFKESTLRTPVDLAKKLSTSLNSMTGTGFDSVLLFHDQPRCRRGPLSRKPPYIMVFECRDSGGSISEDFSWIPMEAIKPSLFPDGDDRRALPSLVRVQKDGGDNVLMPWERPGWFTRTSEAMIASLSRYSYSVIGDVTYWKYCPFSAVLKARTTSGDVFLKACSSSKQCSMAECIGSLFPYLTRKPICVNIEERWILMDDYGITVRNEQRECGEDEFKKIEVLLAQFHMDSLPHIPKLLSAGVPRADPMWMVRKFKEMMHDENIVKQLIPRGNKYFPVLNANGEPDVDFYCDLYSYLIRLLYERQTLPLTLVHGDLHRDNMTRVNEQDYILFDWEMARIDIPFSDIGRLRASWFGYMDSESTSDGYLKLWGTHGSVAHLENLVDFCNLKDSIVSLLEAYDKLQDHFDADLETLVLDRIRYDCRMLHLHQLSHVSFKNWKREDRFASNTPTSQ